MNWDGWTEWVELDTATPPKQAGAYVISCGRPTDRIGGSDPEGLLDIGESSSLFKRIGAFRKCATGVGTVGHMAGWRLRVTGLTNRLGTSKLRVRWCVGVDKGAAYRAEGALLGAYLRMYGELPPLNYKFNWSNPATGWQTAP